MFRLGMRELSRNSRGRCGFQRKRELFQRKPERSTRFQCSRELSLSSVKKALKEGIPWIFTVIAPFVCLCDSYFALTLDTFADQFVLIPRLRWKDREVRACIGIYMCVIMTRLSPH